MSDKILIVIGQNQQHGEGNASFTFQSLFLAQRTSLPSVSNLWCIRWSADIVSIANSLNTHKGCLRFKIFRHGFRKNESYWLFFFVTDKRFFSLWKWENMKHTTLVILDFHEHAKQIMLLSHNFSSQIALGGRVTGKYSKYFPVHMPVQLCVNLE